VEGGRERRNWRQHPLLKRLPILLLVAMGLWLWKGSSDERELVWVLEGPGWSDIRAMDFQVKNEAGELVKREAHSFPRGPPIVITEKVNLPSGRYEVWVFVRGDTGVSKRLPVERLTLGDEDKRVERGLRLPTSR
jgi:hypothetical protein